MEKNTLGNDEMKKLGAMESLTGCQVESFDGKYLEISIGGNDYRTLTNRGELVEAVLTGQKILELRMSEDSERTILFCSVTPPSSSEEKEENINQNKEKFLAIH